MAVSGRPVPLQRCNLHTEVIAMHSQSKIVDFAARDPDTPVPSAPPAGAPAPTATAYLLDADSEGLMRRCFGDLGFVEGHVAHGSIDTAIQELPQRGWPRFLIVDISRIADPLPSINRLAEICDPTTEVIVVGERNDIVLYRELKAAGVAEYFYKP